MGELGSRGSERLTRRQLLIRTALGVGGVLTTSIVAACAQPSAPASAPAPAAPAASPAAPAAPAAPAPAAPKPTEAAPAAKPAEAAKPTTAPAQATQPRQGGTLNVSQSVDINTLHPWVGTLNVWKVIKENVYDQLSYQDPTTFEFKPKLARSFEWTDNNTSLLITLPSGVTFHNGEKLTAEDVKFTLDGIRDANVGSWLRGFLASVKEVQVVDETHLKVKTETVENILIPAFTYIDIVPRSQGTDLAKANPIGSGPFKFVEWVPNDHITIERYDRYWSQEGAAQLDRIVFKPVTELQTRISQLLAGNVDLVYDFSLQEAPRLQADRRVTVTVVPPADQMFVAYLNMRKPPFDKVEARQALAWALDREAFVKNFLAGLGQPSNSPFTEKHWAYDPKTKDAYGYDLDKAAQLLEKAGYPKGQGLEFSFIAPSGYPEFKQISTMLQAAFSQIGYQPAIEEMEIGQWAARINQSRDFFVAVDYPPRGTADPALTFGAGLLFPPTAANAGGLTAETMPGYAEALREGATTTDQAKRKAAYTKVQELWMQHMPGPIFAHRSTVHASLPSVKNFVPHPAFQQSFSAVTLEK